MKKNRKRVAALGATVLAIAVSSAVLLGKAPPPSPEVICVDYTPSPVSSVGLDHVYLGDVRVILRNAGGTSCGLGGLVLTLGGKEFSTWAWGEISPLEEREFTVPCRYGLIERQLGAYSLTGKLRVLDRRGQVLLDQDLTFTLPTLGMGDVLPEVEWTESISFTPLSWVENLTVTYTKFYSYRGPELRTVEADQGTKFVLLYFRYQNHSAGVQKTPWIGSGEIATDEGLLYPLTPYSEAARWVDLSPGESVEGFFTFQIPEGARPVEASLQCLNALVRF